MSHLHNRDANGSSTRPLLRTHAITHPLPYRRLVSDCRRLALCLSSGGFYRLYARHGRNYLRRLYHSTAAYDFPLQSLKAATVLKRLTSCSRRQFSAESCLLSSAANFSTIRVWVSFAVACWAYARDVSLSETV